VADATKAHQLLNWAAKISLEDGLRETIQDLLKVFAEQKNA
jgi:nucleoside-diphosphate-sugar epimerase